MSNRVYDRDCPQCGPGVAGDEDGCCAGCGSTLCGAWVADLRDSARVRDARYIGVIEALLHGIDEYWEEHDGRETVLDAIRLVEESKP